MEARFKRFHSYHIIPCRQISRNCKAVEKNAWDLECGQGLTANGHKGIFDWGLGMF